MFYFYILYVGESIGTTVNPRKVAKLEKTKQELEENNNLLRTKLDILFEMLAEVTAEHELRRLH